MAHDFQKIDAWQCGLNMDQFIIILVFSIIQGNFVFFGFFLNASLLPYKWLLRISNVWISKENREKDFAFAWCMYNQTKFEVLICKN